MNNRNDESAASGLKVGISGKNGQAGSMKHGERILLPEWLERKTERQRSFGAMILGGVLVAAAALLFSKLHEKSAGTPETAIPVTVRTLAERKMRLWSEFPARLQAVDFAEIRPEVGGRITEVHFEDGQSVRKGDVLFVIDPEPYAAALARAQANADFAKKELDRAEGLVKAQAIAQRIYDERANASRVADAELARARIDHERAFVKAPFSGRASRPEITVGNVVQAGSGAPLLTTVLSGGKIYADFEVDEQTYLETIRGNADGRDQERHVPVVLTLPNDKQRAFKGSVYSFDNRIDAVSGTIRVRAKFDNAGGALLPGMTVSVNVGDSKEASVLVVPARAVGIDQNKKFVYVIGKDDKVAYREVVLGKQVDSDRIVLSGLQAGDRVIVDGVQHVHPDALVAPQEDAAPSVRGK
jgi:multidrug efflux system membrane fusion protein